MPFADLPVLSLTIWCPIVFGLLILMAGKRSSPAISRYIALVGSMASLGISLLLVAGFDRAKSGMQFVEKVMWIERFQICYALGIDGISLWLVVLTAFILCIVVLSAWNSDKTDLAQYFGAFLILSGLMIGTFCELEGMLF